MWTYTGTAAADTVVLDASDGMTVHLYHNGVLVQSQPLAAVDGFTFDALDGDDTLTVINPANGLFAPIDGIVFNGGAPSAPPGDALIIDGGTITETTVTYTNTTDGFIILASGATTVTYTFTGLDPIDMSGSTITDLVFNLPPSAGPVFLEDNGTAADNTSQIRSGSTPAAFDTTTFATPTQSLTVNSGAGDTITIELVENFGATDLIVGNPGQAPDTINVGNFLAGTGGNLTLTATGAVAESGADAGADITADALSIAAASVALAGSPNDVSAITVLASGLVEFRDADDLIVGVSGAGITSGGNDVNLGTGTSLAIDQPLNAGTGDVRLVAGTTVTQLAAGVITADELGILAGGNVTLAAATNDANTLAVSTTGAIEFRDGDDLVVGEVLTGGGAGFTTVTGLTSNGGNINLNAGSFMFNQAVDAGTGDVRHVAGTTVTQVAAGAIIADELGILAGGNVTLAAVNNDVNTLAVNATAGAMLVEFRDSDDLTIGAVAAGGTAGFTGATGITTNGGDVNLNAGSLTFNQAVNAGTADIRLVATTIVTQTGGAITADELGIQAGGDITLTSATNDVNTLAISTTGIVNFADADDLTIGSVAAGGGAGFFGATGVTSNNNDVTLSVGSTLTVGQVNAGTGDVNLSAGGGATGLILSTNPNDNVAEVIGDTVTLTASGPSNGNTGQIGSFSGTAQFFEVDAATLNASTTDSRLWISEVGAGASAGAQIGLVNAGTNTAFLRVRNGGSLTSEASDPGVADITAAAVNLTAPEGGNFGVPGSPLEIDATDLSADITGGVGAINIRDVAGGLNVTLAQTVSGNITLEAAGVGAGLTLTTVNAGGAIAALSADGSINGAVGGTADVTAAQAALAAGAGIGTTAALETDVDTLAFTNTAGAVNITNAGALTIGAVGAIMAVSNTGTTTTITATSPVTFAVDTTSAGTLTSTATDSPAAGDDLTINAGVTVESTGGDVVLQAGDNFTLGAGASVEANGTITVALDFGNADPGVGGTATLDGALTATSVQITGNSDGDTVATAVSVLADLTVNGQAGDDVIGGGGGDDLLIGGADDDTAVFHGDRSDYQVDLLANGDILVTDLRGGAPDGVDTVREVENFRFANGDFALEAPSLVVTTDQDVVDPIDNETSLREALILANSLDNGGDALNDGLPDVITFDAGLIGNVIVLTNGELVISSDLTIDGDVDGDDTADIAIDGDGSSRVFNVTAGVSTLDALVIIGGSAAGAGGGITIASTADLTVVNATVAGNEAVSGGGIYNAGDLTLINGTLAGNIVTGIGGGLYNASGATATLINATLWGNSAGGVGGGIYNASGATVSLSQATLSGNSAAGVGGAIYNASGGIASLNNSIVLGNGAPADADVSSADPITYAGVNIVGLAAVPGYGDYDASDHVITAPSVGAVFAAVTTIDPNGTPGDGDEFAAGLLADNAGRVPTIALNADASNPAIDTGTGPLPPDTEDLDHDSNNTEVLPVDARGFDRDVDFNGTPFTPDLGAFEQQNAVTFIVNTLQDGGADDFGGGDLATEASDGGGLSLREALALADEDPRSADAITFDGALIGGTIVLASGELVVDGDVRIIGDIDGDGAFDITVDGDGASAVFHVYSGTARLEGLRITGGNAYYGAGVSVGAFSPYGSVFAPPRFADVTISNSIVDANSAVYGGGISVDAGSSLRLVNSTVSGNEADIGGGIAVNDGGTLTVIGSTVSDNHVDLPTSLYGYGGGIANAGTAALYNTTVAGNSAYDGGGLYNSGDLTLVNTTLANNDAEFGGGLLNADCGCGSATLINSTVSGNYAAVDGGGIYNAAGTVGIINTIVAGNSAGLGYADLAPVGAMTYAGVNVFSQAGVGQPGTDIYAPNPADIFEAIDPATGGGLLADNGGPVQTIAILDGGVAHNVGDTDELPLDTADLDHDTDVLEDLPVDARGRPRVVNGIVDVGAFEINDDTPPSGTVGGTIQYIEDQAPTALDPSLTVTDPGGFLIQAQVVITANLAPDQDVLGFTDQNGITGSYDPASGVLSLVGSATVADYQAALRSVTYFNTSQNPSDADRTVEVRVDDGDGLVGLGSVGVDVVPVLDPPGDANGDHTTDILWRNEEGTVDLWTMQGVGVLGNQFVATLPTYWHIVDADSDFDGDGRSDILWRDDAGAVVLWTMDGATILSNTSLGTLPAYWHVEDTADFTGDGRADILWRDDAGTVVLWEMNGATVMNNTVVANVATTSHIEDAADYTGDGHADILWHGDDGSIRLWEMNGATVVGETFVATIPDTLEFQGSGDFNHDNRFDIVWRDETSGTARLWEMDGHTILADTALGTLPDYWLIADLGDYTGDLNSDILWRDTAGTIVLWEMNGHTIVDDTAVNTIGTQWQVVA